MLMSYLPDWKVGQKEIDRDFIWSIIQHAMPKYGSRLMAEAIRKRAKLYEDNRAKEKPMLNLPQNVIDELLNEKQLRRKYCVQIGLVTPL